MNDSLNTYIIIINNFCSAFSQEQRNLKDGLVLFSLKDKDFLGMSNQYIAEAYVHFSEIPESQSKLTSIPQMHLLLSRPTLTGHKNHNLIVVIYISCIFKQIYFFRFRFPQSSGAQAR